MRLVDQYKQYGNSRQEADLNSFSADRQSYSPNTRKGSLPVNNTTHYMGKTGKIIHSGTMKLFTEDHHSEK